MLRLLLAAAIAQAAPAAPAPTLADRFVAAFPAEQRPESTETRSDAAEADWLVGLNPAREAEIRRILELHTACVTPLMARISDNGLRWIAARLGEEKLARIVRYFESGDAAFFDALQGRVSSGTEPSPEDQARVERILADYPLEDYAEALSAASERDEPLFAELFQCDHARDDAFLPLNLRYEAEAAD